MEKRNPARRVFRSHWNRYEISRTTIPVHYLNERFLLVGSPERGFQRNRQPICTTEEKMNTLTALSDTNTDYTDTANLSVY